MSEIATALREALTDAGHAVDAVEENRGLVRVRLRTSDAPAEELRALAEEAAGDALLGVDVGTERAGEDAVGTVLSVRHR